MVRIAVEHPFTDVRRALKKKGYQAEMVKQTADAAGYDVLVARKQNTFTGSDAEGSVVETSGRSVNEIIEEVEERLQRAGKIAGHADATKGSSGGRFTTGVVTGALVGAAAALLLTPKSGKEMQSAVKEKISSGNSGEDGNEKLKQVKEKAGEVANQAKEKATEVTNQVKEKADVAKEQNGNGGSKEAEKPEKHKNEQNKQS
ncbi:YkuS family protein [Planomicrobium sp. Y74]|uniref:YkuS family protein n=1 Tax=Planomicrobium sp. Y74 TaxID=2478977 RepID=UPI000EF471F9|nr:YkuS family protein [Planomicrobium sp. Y74]RLQ84926.1 hypothetical protein D9754_16815 [Planomicrobium sp. Y74]